MKFLAALIIALLSVAWLVLSADGAQMQALHLFWAFVPLTLAIGFGGLWLAWHAWRHEGWTDRTAGLAKVSNLLVAWGGYGACEAVRRAALADGYSNALLSGANGYRVGLSTYLVLSCLLVVRWITKRHCDEWGWAAVALTVASVVVLASDQIQAVLVWVYGFIS